jgi:hypothetical protein
MRDLLQARRISLTVLLVSAALLVLAVWLRGRAVPSAGKRAVDQHPELFVEELACPRLGGVLENGRRSEELALLRSDRYAYDPRDGVRAVQRYQEAEACYGAAGATSDVIRVRRSITSLTARVNTDYAAARLNLVNALEQDRWSDALREIHRLLLLTDHLRRHEYVEWLEKIIGKVAARASTAV